MPGAFTYTVHEPDDTKATRSFSWPCPSCGETLVAHSEPSLGRFVNEIQLEDAHAAFLDGFREFVAAHMKEHADARSRPS